MLTKIQNNNNQHAISDRQYYFIYKIQDFETNSTALSSISGWSTQHPVSDRRYTFTYKLRQKLVKLVSLYLALEHYFS